MNTLVEEDNSLTNTENRDGHIKITADMVMVKKENLKVFNEDSTDNHIEMMDGTVFVEKYDVLPIRKKNGEIDQCYKTKKPNIFVSDNIEPHTITEEDKKPHDTTILEIMEGFSTEEDRYFYFLTNQSEITGYIHLSNLNNRHVKVFLFSLLCELEHKLGKFIYKKMDEIALVKFIEEKPKSERKWQNVRFDYLKAKGDGLNNVIVEHLYLDNFFEIIRDKEFFKELEYDSINQWDELKDIYSLRNTICHPTRNLLSEGIKKCHERIIKIKDLTTRLNSIL